MFSRRRFLPLLTLAVLTLLVGCGNDAPKVVTPKSIEDRFPIKVGERIVQMQLALLPAEQQKGLMFRKSMGEDEGMIFVFGQPRQQGFWMRDTEIPLDIGYFDASGELKEIYPMYPHDERSVNSRSKQIKFCLEMNLGWFSRAGIKAGAKLDLKALVDAVKARGVDPEKIDLR